jgi:hypothetical protein
VIAVAIVAAGCGGGGGGGGSDGAAGKVASLGANKHAGTQPTGAKKKKMKPADAMRAFARCMREHGIDMADPKVDANGGGLVQIGPGPEAGGGGPSPARPD